MSLSQNFILGSLQHIPYQRSLSYYHFLLFFLSIFHKKYPGFSRTSPNSFVESFIAEIVAATDPSNDNPDTQMHVLLQFLFAKVGINIDALG